MSDNNIAAKVAEVRAKCGSLATDKRNPQGGYEYISADKILERVGDAMATVGLTIVPSITRADVDQRASGGGKGFYFATIDMAMQIMCDGASEVFPWTSAGVDYSGPDKALFKAITSGHKYFLMKLFNVGVGNEDGEHENVPPAAASQNGGTSDTPTAPRPAPPKSNGKAAPPSAPDKQVDAVSTARAVIETWKSPVQAQNWAVQIGGEPNGFAAQNAWKKVVTQLFGEGGSYGPKELPGMFEAYYEHVMENVRNSAGVAVAEEIPV